MVHRTETPGAVTDANASVRLLERQPTNDLASVDEGLGPDAPLSPPATDNHEGLAADAPLSPQDTDNHEPPVTMEKLFQAVFKLPPRWSREMTNCGSKSCLLFF